MKEHNKQQNKPCALREAFHIPPQSTLTRLSLRNRWQRLMFNPDQQHVLQVAKI